MICEKCWRDASESDDHLETYYNLIYERKASPCTPKEQAGEYWDEKNQCDIRNSYYRFKDENCIRSH